MATESRSETAGRLDPRTGIGAVSLTVSDLARSVAFYERTIGLSVVDVGAGRADLGVSGEPPIVVLHEDVNAPALNRRETGLYHQAILVPNRRELAMALARLAAARWPLDGASDHLVSEALYLSDPDGNGIEIYRDRPREAWPYDADGTLGMGTLPLDLQDVLSEISGPKELTARMAAGTRIGHVHLQVSELTEIQAFYEDVIGLDVIVRLGGQALFMSAGGYHHHVGMNTWHSRGGHPPAPGSVGLRWFDLALASEAERSAVMARAGAFLAGEADGEPLLRDPSGNGVRLIVHSQ